MEHYQIRYFLAAARSLHFTRAAEAAGVSQPALTKAIQKLEDELGAPLFLRDGRMVVLTEFGQLMRDKLGRVVEARREAELAATRYLSPQATQLNVGVMCTIGPSTLVDLLSRFRIEHPDIKLHLHDVTPASGYAGLESGGLDCAVVATESAPAAAFKSRKLYRERMVIAFSAEHRFNMMSEVAFGELDGERYIDRLHCEFRDMFLEQLRQRDMDLDFPFSSEREDWIQSMIAGGLGICLLPEFLVEAPGVRTRRIVDPPLERSVEIAYRPGHENSHGLMALLDQASQVSWPVIGENWRGGARRAPWSDGRL
jgi:LysR family transcriptional regulator, hydrogen peroxide-inducible genes activator